MCGIVGVFSKESLSPRRSVQVAEALEMLTHRGPDDLSQKGFTHAILGHTRLAIVDLSSVSNQPFSDHQGLWWITWNGEIYNFQELRLELESLGHHFRTLSDTEVLLTAYIQWGETCQERLNGMWSLAIFNRVERTLFLSRDRFGIKPLYWAQSGKDLFFSSEMKPLFCFGIPRTPNWTLVSRYLRDTIVPESRKATVFTQIFSLPPGHSLSISQNGSQTLRRWWRLPIDPEINDGRCFEDRVSYFRYLFEDSVRLRARNDVPTAVSLSGGVDSASIYGACCKLLRKGELLCASNALKAKELKVCSVIYPGSRVNEHPWIDACLKQWDRQDDFLPVHPLAKSLPTEIHDIIWFQESPVWSPAILSLHSLYRRISEAGIRVVLEGHGADEMLGGYPLLVKTALAESIANRQFSDAGIAFYCLIGMHSVPGSFIGSSKLRGLHLAVRDLCSILSQCFQNQNNVEGKVRTPHSEKQLFSQELMTAWANQDSMIQYDGRDFNAVLHKAFTETILPFFLRVFDRATMAYGVESCVPFLDHRLVEFVFSLPKSDKVGRLSKRILREAGKEWLPFCVRNRRGKTPFTAPIGAWFNSAPVREYLTDVFDSVDALSSSCIKARNVIDFIETRKGKPFTYHDIQQLWKVLNLHLWDRIVCRTST